MNSSVKDDLAISWRLAVILKGYGRPHLLASYEDEQRSTMVDRLERCRRHIHRA